VIAFLHALCPAGGDTGVDDEEQEEVAVELTIEAPPTCGMLTIECRQVSEGQHLG
jgi:hypothetical protein